jgi:transmembrane sensor
MNPSPSSDLLARYLAGEATSTEAAEVEAWAAAQPAHARELERLRALMARGQGSAWDVERAWTRVSARIDQPIPLARSHRAPPLLLALAAALVLALGAGLLWQMTRPALVETPGLVATTVGERRVLELPDGTRITLAPDTELRVAAGYGRALRRVDLSGEAWFDVPHDASRPVLVHAGGTITEDLGTEFAIRAIPGSGLVRLAVASGSASLRREGASATDAVTLHAADVAELRDEEAEPVVRRGVTLDPYVSWHTGQLSFEDTPLELILPELARWFGLAAVVEDPAAAARRFTGPLPLDRRDEAIEILAAALVLRVEWSADTVRFRNSP